MYDRITFFLKEESNEHVYYIVALNKQEEQELLNKGFTKTADFKKEVLEFEKESKQDVFKLFKQHRKLVSYTLLGRHEKGFNPLCEFLIDLQDYIDKDCYKLLSKVDNYFFEWLAQRCHDVNAVNMIKNIFENDIFTKEAAKKQKKFHVNLRDSRTYIMSTSTIINIVDILDDFSIANLLIAHNSVNYKFALEKLLPIEKTLYNKLSKMPAHDKFFEAINLYNLEAEYILNPKRFKDCYSTILKNKQNLKDFMSNNGDTLPVHRLLELGFSKSFLLSLIEICMNDDELNRIWCSYGYGSISRQQAENYEAITDLYCDYFNIKSFEGRMFLKQTIREFNKKSKYNNTLFVPFVNLMSKELFNELQEYLKFILHKSILLEHTEVYLPYITDKNKALKLLELLLDTDDLYYFKKIFLGDTCLLNKCILFASLSVNEMLEVLSPEQRKEVAKNML